MDYQIAMLWMRGRLSFLEQLCVKSFLDVGHHVTLYSYEPVEGVPDGVEHRDASEILSETDALVHEGTGSPALHSDVFRYRLLQGNDRTIWADTDAYCQQKFSPVSGHLHGYESEHDINGGVLCLPQDSETLRELLEFTSDPFAVPPFIERYEGRKRADDLRAAVAAGKPFHAGLQPWGVWGPHAITHFLKTTGEVRYTQPRHVLYPYTFAERRKIFRERHQNWSAHIKDETQSIHLYGRGMRNLLLKNVAGMPSPAGLLGHLLQKHGIDPTLAPLKGSPALDPDSEAARIYRQAARDGGATPVRSPEPVAKADVPAASDIRPLDDVVAITTMRNEGPFILDWVAYHLSVGITHFVVYTNDCDDPTDAILDALAERGLVTRVDNPVEPGERPQRVALEAAGHLDVVRNADAYVVMDVDEFINIHVGNGRLHDLFEAAGDPDLLSMTWRFFGASGRTDFTDDPAPMTFSAAAPEFTRKPHQNWGFKTLVRRGAPFSKIGVHRPLDATGSMPAWTNGSGDQMPDDFLSSGWRSSLKSWGYGLVTLNHYATRSVDSFLVKRDRGRTNHINRDQGVEYWNLHNRNDETDDRIFDRWQAAVPVRKLLSADPKIGALHDEAVTWHRNRANALKSDPGYASLYELLARDASTHEVPEIDLPDAQVLHKPEPKKKPKPKAPAPTSVDSRMTPAGDPILAGQEAEDAYVQLAERAKRFPFLSSDKGMKANPKITVVSSMRNEAPFILEWIAYNRSIGVTDFLIFTNDCDDQTVEILDRLSQMGVVTRRDNPFDAAKGQRPQRIALNVAASDTLVTEADWTLVIDNDEFIDIHVGDGTLPSLIHEMGDPNVISMTWRMFGNSGIDTFEDRFVTEQFTKAAPKFLPKPRLGWGFKSMVHRSAPFGKIGVHRPLELDQARIDEVRWVNGSGRVMPDELISGNGWRSTKRTVGYDMVTLNHYVLRSAESYLVKRQRGRINHVDQDQGFDYWARRNYNSESVTSIERHIPRAKVEFDRLMGDGPLAKLHREAVEWHAGRIETLKATSDYSALFKAITASDLDDAIYLSSWLKDAAEKAAKHAAE